MIYDMRMKIYGLIIIALLMGACSSDKPSKKCIYPAGDLLFSKEKASWSEVYIDKKYDDTVLVYNPTKAGIRLEGFNHFPEITCRKIGHSVQDCNLGGYTVEPGTCDTLIVTLRLKNESMLGNYYNVMRFMINGEVDYDYGFMIDVPVREDFAHWSEEEKAQAPHFMVDSTERDFGILREGEEAKMIFKIQNVGERNLIIRKIETTCGCTAVLPGQRMLLPGKEMDLNVIFHSAGRNGKQRKVITLFCNDPRQPTIQVIVKVEVKV